MVSHVSAECKRCFSAAPSRVHSVIVSSFWMLLTGQSSWTPPDPQKQTYDWMFLMSECFAAVLSWLLYGWVNVSHECGAGRPGRGQPAEGPGRRPHEPQGHRPGPGLPAGTHPVPGPPQPSGGLLGPPGELRHWWTNREMLVYWAVRLLWHQVSGCWTVFQVLVQPVGPVTPVLCFILLLSVSLWLVVVPRRSVTWQNVGPTGRSWRGSWGWCWASRTSCRSESLMSSEEQYNLDLISFRFCPIVLHLVLNSNWIRAAAVTVIIDQCGYFSV